MSGNNSPNNRFPLPENWSVDEFICMCIPVPDDADYIAIMRGLLETLTWQRSFNQHPTENAARQVSNTWLAAFRSQEITFVECSMPDFRLDPETCALEVNCSGDPDNPDWRKVLDTKLNPYPDPDPNPVSGTACLAAANAADGLRLILLQLDQALALGTVVFWIEVYLTLYLLKVVQRIAQTVTRVTNVVIDFTAEEFHDAYEAFDWDVLKNVLHCYYDENGVMNEVQLALLLDELAPLSLTDPVWTLIYLLVEGMGAEGMTGKAPRTTITEATCENCEGWSHTWNAELGWDGWTVFDDNPDYGALSSGKWLSVNASGDELLVVNSPALDENTSISGFVFKYLITLTSTPPFGQHRVNWLQSDVWNYNLKALDWTNGEHQTSYADGVNQQRLQFDIEVPIGYLTVELTEAIFYGDGDDPYD